MPDPRGGRRIDLLGTRVDALTFQETLDCVDEIVRERRPTQHVVLNAAKIVAVRSDPDLKRIVEGCGLINADGTAVVWASRILGTPLPERVTGVDLMQALIRKAAERSWGIYFLGARTEVLERVVRRIQQEFPGVRVAGWRDGYFGEDQTPAVVREIAGSGADLLLVGLPSPRKEIWLQENLAALNVPFCMGVGGSFDVFAGVVRRAPRWIQAVGLEWLFRLLQEPRRLWKRYLVTNTQFLVIVAAELLYARRRRPSVPSR